MIITLPEKKGQFLCCSVDSSSRRGLVQRLSQEYESDLFAVINCSVAGTRFEIGVKDSKFMSLFICRFLLKVEIKILK